MPEVRVYRPGSVEEGNYCVNERKTHAEFRHSERIISARRCSSRVQRASSDAMPAVQLKIISPNAAASANVPCDASEPFLAAHEEAFSLLAEREPILTL